MQQLGGPADDIGRGIALSGGAIFLTGQSKSGWLGSPATVQGGDDMFVARLDAEDGALHWLQLLGAPGDDCGHGIAVRGDDIMITGVASGQLPSRGVWAGGTDIMLVRYSKQGERRGVWQTGRDGADGGRALAFAGDTLFLTGYVHGGLFEAAAPPVGSDLFVALYNVSRGLCGDG
jgi:hypothetical protein